MLHLVAWYPQLMTFEELQCHHLWDQAAPEELECMTQDESGNSVTI